VNADFILLHARQLLTAVGPAPRRGPQQADIQIVEDAAIAAHEGRLVFVGPSGALAHSVVPLPHARIVDLGRTCTLLPGFVDAHTHAMFAGDRSQELRRRLAGETYARIAAEGGGILATVAATRKASEDELVALTHLRLDRVLACGTTTCEIKSGYGLTTAAELRMLRALRVLAGRHPMSIVATFLGAHEIPPEYRSDRSRYAHLVVEEMIPAVAAEGLAEWCDVFCEQGVFTPDESAHILASGREAGLKPRIHADELGSSGGSRVAAALGARSADHLVFATSEDIRALADAEITATLLPAAAFYLKLGRYAPARELIEAGVPVALASDLNPGGGLSPSLPFVLALACFAMHMTFEEALTGVTLNAAWSLDRADEVGSLEPGKLADIVILDGDPVDLLRAGAVAIAAVIKRGAVVHGSIPYSGSPGGGS
jgi:imidazolonepropionase